MTDNSTWYRDAIFYELYVRAFRDDNRDGHGDLRGLLSKLDYLQWLGIDCIWLLPIYPSPLKDDGYDIADYYDIHPDYGTLEDFKALVKGVHERGMRLIVDLVMNHTSDQHPWFVESRSSKDSPMRDFYVWSPTNTRYAQARVIFVDTEESNWAYDERTGEYYWHRFYSSQPDLNYDNPKVQQAMLDVIRFWLELGVDGFRADAVPYLFEREGTNCESLPETHEYLKRVRRFIDENFPGRILLAEANQWPEDVLAYFGDGDEFHMAFHFPLMPRLFMALALHDRTPIVNVLAKTPSLPDETQWCIFLRNHDELTLEMVSEEEREFMWSYYAPDPRMRLNLGIRRRLAPLLDNDRRKIELLNSLLFTLPGSPIIYYGDEIGMGDNISLPDRNGVRTPMQWSAGKNAGFSEADELYAPVNDDEVYGYRKVNVDAQRDDPGSLLNWTRHIIRVRKSLPALARGTIRLVDVGDEAVLAFWREVADQKVLTLHNLADSEREVSLDLSDLGGAEVKDEVSGQGIGVAVADFKAHLPPYGYLWLSFSDGGVG